MAASFSKKFALLCCSLMTMQALRLVISTAGFCVVRFHIDCELFNIFISRLVNAVYMAQLFGNWLGDLIVFIADGKWKIYSLALTNWIEFTCFCTALFSICHSEVGHLNGFYWSMVCAYFWWKVGEAPTVSIGAPDATDYYFAGFTLSGVWAACLKGLVMWFVAGSGSKTLHFHSDALGDVNLTVVGARSVKTTSDYHASVLLFAITITLTFLMCLPWSVVALAFAASQNEQEENELKKMVAKEMEDKLKKAKEQTQGSSNQLQDAIRKLGEKKNGVVSVTTATETSADFSNAQVANVIVEEAGNQDKVQITVQSGVTYQKDGQPETNWTNVQSQLGGPVNNALFGALIGMVVGMVGFGNVTWNGTKIDMTANAAGVLKDGWVDAAKYLSGIAFGAVLAVPGAMLGAGMGWGFALCFKCCLPTASYASLTKMCQFIFGTVGALGTIAGVTYAIGATETKTDSENDWNKRMWIEALKWPAPNHAEDWKKIWAPMMGLVAGLVVGALSGLIVGAIIDRTSKGDDGRSQLWFAAIESGRHSELVNVDKSKTSLWRGTAAGAFVGSFFGLWFGEIANGKVTWQFGQQPIVVCGFLINVLALGTVYSIYPGMAPCSITQFKYFNIIDILILILSSIVPIVIMGLDLAELPQRLAKTINNAFKPDPAGTGWMAMGVLLLITTNICEIIVLSIMQHPFSKIAQKVKTCGWRAVLLTVTMVTSQLTSANVGFGSVAVGSGFNDGVNNAHSTLVLWTMECCGVLGEGYLTELKKYEPGKWPTQGMGKWATYKWWNNKAFGNAWAIWCCIGTTDLRRDIMLCRK